MKRKVTDWKNLWEPLINPKFIKHVYKEFSGSLLVKTPPSTAGE